jgi:HPt (histidine-containing phosphotransfer) domain-containing protein
LKGSAGNLGANPLSAISFELQEKARFGSLENASEILVRLEKELKRVEDFLNAELRT